MRYDWNEAKSAANYKKHEVRFEDAQAVFIDMRAIEFFDELHSVGEERFIRIGMSGNLNLLVVVDCERETESEASTIRIISARKATAEERRVYEKRI